MRSDGKEIKPQLSANLETRKAFHYIQVRMSPSGLHGMNLKQIKIFFILLLLIVFGSFIHFSDKNVKQKNNNIFLLRNLSTTRSDYSNAVANSLVQVARKEHPRSSKYIPPFVSLRVMEKFRIAPQYHLGYCIVRKSMGSVMKGLMCYLYDSDLFEQNNASITNEWFSRKYCRGTGDYNGTSQLVNQYAQMLDVVFFTRDPLQRFLSGFVDKCINEEQECYGCNKSITCTIDGLYEELKFFSSPGYLAWSKKMITYEGIHFAPQNWHCEIGKQGEEFIYIKYGEDPSSELEMKETLLSVLREHGVEERKLSHIQDNLQGKTGHATKSSGAREYYQEQLLSSPTHLQKFIHIFYFDYILFGYKPPNIW